MNAESKPKSTIALIGMRGCGKTTVARILAAQLGGTAVDTDELVMSAAGQTIAEIFAAEGEHGFRHRERAVIATAIDHSPAVISVGGGAILDERNLGALRGAATIVWLTASASELWHRIESDPKSSESRPSLSGEHGLKEVTLLLSQREQIYREAADVIVNTTGRKPVEVAQLVASAVASVDQ